MERMKDDMKIRICGKPAKKGVEEVVSCRLKWSPARHQYCIRGKYSFGILKFVPDALKIFTHFLPEINKEQLGEGGGEGGGSS
jgi:hypothetical protein